MKTAVHLSIFIFLLSGCLKNNDLGPVELDLNDVALEKAENVEILYSDSAQIRLKIRSDLLLRSPDRYNPYEEFPQGVEAEFYGNHEELVAWLEADYAIRKEREQLVIARSNVILRNRDNQMLETPELIWNERNETIYSDKFVKITEANGDITFGFGFRSNQNFSNFQILSVESRRDMNALLKREASTNE